MQDLGYVDYFDNLTPEEQELIQSSHVKYFIPWLAVWSKSSVTTPALQKKKDAKSEK